MAKINVRSPYYITVSALNLTQCDMELYIYEGVQTTDRGTSKYNIQSIAYNDFVTFEISELVRDYVTSDTVVYVDYRLKNYISGVAGSYGSYVQLTAFNGYGYFEDGVNPLNEKMALISNSKMLIKSNETINIPVDSTLATTINYYSDGVLVDTETPPAIILSSYIIFYASSIVDGIDSIEVTDGINVETISVEQIEECLNDVYKLIFINKFGASQKLWFFKKSSLTLTTKEEKYKRNIISRGGYDSKSHVQKILKKQGNEKITLNSGFYPEENNEVFRQLLLSDEVWIEINSQVLPINISSSSFQFKTQLNDKLINYTIEVEYAFDKINNIA